MHFGISEGKGGLKIGSRPWLGMDIFWNCPLDEAVEIYFIDTSISRLFSFDSYGLYCFQESRYLKLDIDQVYLNNIF